MNSGVENRKRILLYALVLLIAVLILLALFGPRFLPHDPYFVDVKKALIPPGKEYLLGTDYMGRCMLCRIIEGMRTSLFTAFAVIVVVFLFGTVYGVAAALFGGIGDSILMKVNLVVQAFPSFILVISIAGMLGPGLLNGIIALCLVSWTHYARLARSMALRLKDVCFIRSARLSGAGIGRIIFRHVLPNILSPLLVTAALDIGGVILSLASLSFVGLSAQRPSAEWGLMISDNRKYLQSAPWTVLVPGAALFVMIVIFNLFADTLRDYTDPKHVSSDGNSRNKNAV